jgi:hypothetical protein
MNSSPNVMIAKYSYLYNHSFDAHGENRISSSNMYSIIINYNSKSGYNNYNNEI